MRMVVGKSLLTDGMCGGVHSGVFFLIPRVRGTQTERERKGECPCLWDSELSGETCEQEKRFIRILIK